MSYDYIVIGSDLGSLALACALSQNTPNVALVDSQDFAGNDDRAVQFPSGAISNGLHFTPDTELAKKAISFLEGLTETNIVGPTRDWPPVTFEQGQLKEFLGFGENTPEFYEEVKFFTNPLRRELLVPPQDWVQLLIQKFKGQFIPRSYVTKFDVVDNKITSITINGSKPLKALNFIYCGPLKSLARLLPENALSTKARAKIAKNTYWSALYVDFCHSHQVTESSAMHILNGTTADDIGPSAGQFQPAKQVNDETLQTSQWVTFVEDDIEEESEMVGQALKKMKRQIKRAYPNALENLKVERIRLAPLVSGEGEIKLTGQQTLGEIENLWIGSGAAHNQKFWIGSLLQAQLVLAAMGFQPASSAEISAEV